MFPVPEGCGGAREGGGQGGTGLAGELPGERVGERSGRGGHHESHGDGRVHGDAQVVERGGQDREAERPIDVVEVRYGELAIRHRWAATQS